MPTKFEGGMGDEDNNYEEVPHEGKVFEEGGKKYYWNFSDAVVGAVVDRVDRGFRGDMDGYFGSRNHVKAAEEKTTPKSKGRIVKWEILDGHGQETKGDPNPDYGKPGSDLSLPDWETYRKKYNL